MKGKHVLLAGFLTKALKRLTPSLFVLLLTPVPVLAENATTTGRASVIDGDTIEMHGVRLRLHGIDAPESAQTCENGAGEKYRCGQRAALALSDRIGTAPVTCERKDTDRYGRTVAVCRQGKTDLNAWLVSEGHAVAYTRYSSDYVQQEAAAKSARRGIWSGAFTPPPVWRSASKLEKRPPRAASTAGPNGCSIKGNINARGDRIYHVPGSPAWAKTRIDERNGERWFCTEEEATAAGWRAPRQK